MNIKSASLWDLKLMTVYEFTTPTINAAAFATILTGVANKRQYIGGITLYTTTACNAVITASGGVQMFQFILPVNTQFTISFDFMPVRNLIRGEGLRLSHNLGVAVSFAVSVWGLIGE